jgi:glycosyltransferase involved in cell wall biosynthesis
MSNKIYDNKFISKISVIVPSYNQKKYIERTLLSIIGQNDLNIELIVVDGNSTDGTIELLYKYEKFIDVLIIEPDNGQASAINKGLKIATGDWICWQNSDDTFSLNAFSLLRSHISKHPFADLIIGNINLIDSEDRLKRDLKYVLPTFNSILSEGMIISNQAAFWKRELHIKIGYLNEDLEVGFDFEWFLKILKVAKASHLNFTLGNLRLHQETKSYLKSELFSSEYKIIRKSREKINYKFIYIIRRFYYLTINLEFKYIIRGILNRITN